MSVRLGVLGLLLGAASAASADQVFLKGGGSISGIVVQQTAAGVVIEVGAGRVTLPAERVQRIASGRSPLAAFRERAQGLAPDDAAGWLQLALWAADQGLNTQARDAFERVVAMDPGNAAAQQGLGYVRLADRWVTPEESYRARGYVYYEGRWVAPEERDELLRQETAREQSLLAGRARAEADARAREAEARALAAEAEAQRAEPDSWDWGYPLAWVGCCGQAHFPRPQRHTARPISAPAPAPVHVVPTQGRTARRAPAASVVDDRR